MKDFIERVFTDDESYWHLYCHDILPGLFFCCIAIVFLFINMGLNSYYKNANNVLKQTTKELTTNIKSLNSRKIELQNLDVDYSNIVEDERVEEDGKLIESFVSQFANWTDIETYSQSREMLLHQVSDSDVFLETYLPEVTPSSLGLSDFINNRNITFDSVNNIVIGIEDSVYSYFVVVSFHGATINGNVDYRDSKSAFTCKVDAEGEMIELTPYRL